MRTKHRLQFFRRSTTQILKRQSRRWMLALCLSAISTAHGLAQEGLYVAKQDVVYGHKDGLALTYDVFTPQAEAKGVGLLFMVSGGWVSSWAPPEEAAKIFKPLLERGYTVIAVRHGSSPRYLIPEIAVDVRKALKHVHDHAAELGVDPKRLGVFGFSAGGHLSLLLGTQTNHAGDAEHSPRIAAVVAVFPPTDLVPYVDPTNPLREQFPALKFEPRQADDYSPLKHVTQDDAATLLVHGDQDTLVPIWHSQKMDAAFQAAGVPHELITIEGAGHGFNAQGNQVMFQGMLRWFDLHLAQ